MANSLTPKEEFLLNPVTEHNITDAAIATFETNLRHGVKVEIPLEPVQSGTGDPSPDNVRPISGWTGTNIKNQIVDIGNVPRNTIVNTFIPSGTTVEIVAKRTSNSGLVMWNIYDESGTKIRSYRIETIDQTDDTIVTNTITLSEDAYSYSFINMTLIWGRVFDVDATTLPISWKHAEGTYEFSPVQEGSGDPSPENVRPIHPGLTITRDDNTELTVYGGSITFNDDGTSRVESKYYCGLIPNDMTYSTPLTNYANAFHYMNDWLPSPLDNKAISDKAVIRGSSDPGDNRDYWLSMAAGGNPWIRLYIRNDLLTTADTSGIHEWMTNNPIYISYQLETPSTYVLSKTETQRAIEALGDKVTTTIYGGTATLNEDGSVDLEVTHFQYEYQSASDNSVATRTPYIETIDGVDYGRAFSYTRVAPGWSIGTLKGDTAIMCDKLKLYTRGSSSLLNGENGAICIGVTSSSLVDFYIKASELDDVSTRANTANSIKKWLVDNQVHFVFETTADYYQHYHFPNIGKLKAFLGTNNIWADIGNVNVKYLTQNSETGMEYRGDRALELRRRAMIADSPTIHTTTGSEETGGLASFKSYVKAPVKTIEIPFSPKQDLHGYDHPWPAGGGKNLWNLEMEEGGIDDRGGDVDQSSFFRSKGYLEVEPNTQYVFSLKNGTPTKCLIKYYDENYNYVGESSWLNKPWTFTTPDNATYLRVVFAYSSEVIQEVQLELGSTATSYEPYENICPIEGHDGCEIEYAGKNFVPDFNGTYEYWSRGWLTSTGDVLISSTPYITSKFVTIKAGSSYIISTNLTDGWRCHAFYDEGKKLIAGTYKETYIGTAPENAKYIRISVAVNHSGVTPLPTTVQLELGSTATDYEPYQGSTLPLIFNQAGDHAFLPIQEGTGDPSPENERPIRPGLVITRDDESTLEVYGGTLTVNSDGTGSISSEYIRRNAQSSWVFGKQSTTGWYMTLSDMPSGYQNSKSYCNVLTKVDSQSSTEFGVVFGYSGANRLVITGSQPTYSTTADLSAYLTEIGACFVYPAATPTMYTLSVAETNRALEALGLSQHIGTLYGGTVTIYDDGSADVVVDKVAYDMGTLAFTKTPFDNTFMIEFTELPILASQRFESWIYCSSYKPARAITLAQINLRQNNGEIFGRNGYKFLYFKDTSYNTAADFIAANNGQTLVIPLATPQTYHFSNLEELKVWLGENNFWCDISDDISVKYWNRGFGN